MRNLCIALFSVLFLAGVNAQINNTWSLAWQNSPVGALCIPETIIVAINSTTNATTVTYQYNSTVQAANCPSTPFTASNLTNTTTNSFNDTNNSTITWVNTTIQSVQFVLNGTNSTFFYLNSGDVFSQASTLGTMGSYWNTPSLSASSNASLCNCAPDTLFVLPYVYQSPALKYYTYYITQPNCSTNISDTLSLFGSTASTVNWQSNTNSNITFGFTPSNSTSAITYSFVNVSANATCTYNYQRNYNTSTILSNANWIPDWQDNGAANITSYPSYYQVNNATTYMTSTYTLNNNSVSSYVVQNMNGQYQDAYLNQAFTYNQPTNTLTVVNYDFIYSQNGSLFNASQFVQFWGTPNPVGSTANCCVFTYVNISQSSTNNNTLEVVYTPPEGYTNASSPCSDFATDYTNGVLESTLAIETPSITGLTWVDQKFNTTITFLNGNSSTIAVQFPSPQQCGINMVVTSPPNPNPPGPLSGSWISTKVMTLVMGLFVVLACM